MSDLEPDVGSGPKDVEASAEEPELLVKPWGDRSNTIGILPGKGDDQLTALKRLLLQLPLDGSELVEMVSAQGTPRKMTCDAICGNQISRGGLVERTSERKWGASYAAQKWLDSGDNLYLARYLHANVKFFGELIADLNEGRSFELLKVAQAYGLHWTTPDQVHRRIGWMQSLGLLERWSLSKVVVTTLGEEFMSLVRLTTKEEAARTPQVSDEETAELPETIDFVSALLRSVDDDSLSGRKAIIGYIPRGKKANLRAHPESQLGVVESVRKFADLIGKGSSFDEIFGRASKVLGQKKTSFTQSMHTFRNMGIIDHTSFNRFAVTPEGRILLEPGQEVNLVRFLHVRYRFVGELLAALRETTTVSAMVDIAAGTYGCTQVDAAEMRTRLNFFVDAGLVERIDWTRYRATARGLSLAGQLPLEPVPTTFTSAAASPEDRSTEVPTVLGRSLSITDIVSDLRRHSSVSDASTEFEESVARAFQFLGFGAEHLGGSGQTDVLLTAELAPGESYRSIVDAKASASGVIGDNAIKFDALKDHQKKHGADFGIVVGPDFVGRVKEWAVNNKFTLLTVDELIGLLERHQKTPLSLIALRELFAHPEGDLTAVDELYDEAADRSELLWRLVDVLYREANEEDPVANGSISVENLHYILRKDMASRPPRAVIEECLAFLASGLVRGVQKSGDKYRITDSPSNIGKRLAALGVVLVNISSDVSRV